MMETVVLWSKNVPMAQGREAADIPSLDVYVPNVPGPLPAILVCPGGGYMHLAAHEGEPIARWLNGLGVAAFVLKYRLGPRYRFPVPVLDGQRAMRWIRHQSSRLGVDAARVGVLGFSAGGHLAAMLSNPPMIGELSDQLQDAIDLESAQPNLAVLAYAVTIMTGSESHRGSAVNLFGDVEAATAMARRCSAPELVGEDNPPTFLWHTAEDSAVPVTHALQYADALAHHGIPFALHVFQHGRHGLGLDPEHEGAQAWTDLLPPWLKDQGF